MKYKLILLLLLMMDKVAVASTTTGMPWETSLDKVVNSLDGPVALGVSTMALILFGLGMSHGQSGSLMHRSMQIGLGVSVAAGATSLLTNLFGMSSGTLL